jgi:hypothetical protein
MQAEGWIFMIGSVGFVLILTAYCFARVLMKPQSADHLQAPQTIDTGDIES